MKIALVTKGLFPITVGGIERHSTLLATHMVRQGADVTVMTPEPDAEKRRDEFPFKVRSLPLPPPTRHWLHTRRAAKLATHEIQTGNFDIVYGQGHTCADYVDTRQRLPLIWNPHGMELFHAVGLKHNLQNLPYRYRFLRLAKGAERVICLGGKLMDILTDKLRIPQSRIVTIPNAIDPDFILKKLDPTVEKAPTDFLFTARLHSNKGADVLIDAFNDLVGEDVGVSLVGDGPLGPELKTRCRNARVRFLGGVSDEELFRQFSRAGAFILPSLFEGMPTVILEAMTAGLPVVSTDIGAARTMVLEGKTGFVVQPGSKEELKRGIRKLMGLSLEERQRIGQQGKEHVLANFTWPVVAKQTLELAEEILRSSRTSRARKR